MARNRQPIAKKAKSLDFSPATMGYAGKDTRRKPKGNMRRKQSEYATQLNEKQKVKFIYGVQEKQFRSYYEKAAKMQGKTGENLLILCERRLDNVVFHLGFATTRRQARQLVTHGHFTVDGKKVDVPSYQVKPGQVVAVKEKSRSSAVFARLTGEDAPLITTTAWLELDKANFAGTVTRVPTREDVDFPVEEHLIVEFYSK